MIKKSPCPSCISRRTGPGRALATATAVNGLRDILGTGGLLTPAFRGSCGVIKSGCLDVSGADYVNVCQDGRKSIGTGVSYAEIGWTPPDTLCHVTCQQSTYWTLSQARVSKALERIRQLVPSHTRGRSRMRDTYGSGRGARGETRAPTATTARVHHVSRRRGCMAAGGSCAAAVYTGDRIFQPQPQLRRHQPVHA